LTKQTGGGLKKYVIAIKKVQIEPNNTKNRPNTTKPKHDASLKGIKAINVPGCSLTSGKRRFRTEKGPVGLPIID